MAEIDGRLAKMRSQLVRLQEDRRAGRDELDVVRALIPICATMLEYVAEVLSHRGRGLQPQELANPRLDPRISDPP